MTNTCFIVKKFNIKIDLQRNLPTDKDTETTRALKLRGLLSDASVIDMLPDDLDSNSELEKIDKQNEENIQKNLQQMQMMGQTGVEQNKNGNKQDNKITDLTEQQKAQKLTADNKKEQTKVVNKQINKE